MNELTALWCRLRDILRRLWMRWKLGRVLKESLVLIILSAVHSVLIKELQDKNRVKSAIRSAVRQAVGRLKLPSGYESFVLEPTLVALDRLIDQGLPDNNAILSRLERFLRAHLGVRD